MTGRILIVDDVATNRIILKVKLSAACYEVIQASGGVEALEVARREKPDLILLDMAMPDLDGLEVCRILRSDPNTAGIRIIVVTAYNDATAKLEALSAGADEFMPKPIDDMGLLARVRSLLRASNIAAELALREGTSQALGFAETPQTFISPGKIALIARNAETATAWQKGLTGRVKDKIEVMDRTQALQSWEGKTVPDLFVIGADLERPGDGLPLLSELRARSATRHSGVIVVVPHGARESAAMALDLGAVDLLSEPFDPEELALRLTTQLARKRQADRLRRRVSDGLQAAVTDPLTGLHNRRYALSHLKRVRERALALGKSFAVMVVDLDRFKRVNDIYGHAAGDAVICAVAERLKANVRSVDLISRIGGEEFLVILPDIQTGPARKAAERLCKAVESSPIAIDMPEEEGEEVAVKSVAADGGQTPFVLPKKNTQRSFFEREVLITQTVSIGLAMGGVGPGAEVEPDSAVVERADKALYLSKNNGRNQVTVGRSSAAA